MCTYDYWNSELKVFRAIFGRSDHPERVYVLALNGLTLMAADLVEHDPGHKTEVLQEFQTCWDLAETVKGASWVLDHIQVVATHGNIPPA